MNEAIACLERELATLATNFAAQAASDACSDVDSTDEQQNLRWRQMESIRRGIFSLRHANQSAQQVNTFAQNAPVAAARYTAQGDATCSH
jgi:hypothetical protein